MDDGCDVTTCVDSGCDVTAGVDVSCDVNNTEVNDNCDVTDSAVLVGNCDVVADDVRVSVVGDGVDVTSAADVGVSDVASAAVVSGDVVWLVALATR